jgi:hypothetical protein
MRVSADRDEDKEHREGLTRRGVWVVLGELHGRLEVTAVVQRVRVQYDKADVPVEDIFVIELPGSCKTGCHYLQGYRRQ